ncbi:MAG: SUF system NifU family Fe-S cluster assembly protein [Alphaproteobacteria bacterium]|nr:SUF system NifU family Fe-S cluster assembly protein [Alphaproteobacteria bacterium]
MSDLRELYQEIILDHNKNPRNFGHPNHYMYEARGDNPLCGDKITVYLSLKNGIVNPIAFEGKGCAISMASASLMTEIIKGKTEQQAHHFFDYFHQLLTHDNPDAAPSDDQTYDILKILTGVKQFPMRVKCATLAWHTLMAALKHEKKATTE